MLIKLQIIDQIILSHLKNIRLADPTIPHPTEIDGILRITVFTEILAVQKIMKPPGTPGANKTSLDFIITGCVNPIKTNPLENNICTFPVLDSLVERMGKLKYIAVTLNLKQNVAISSRYFKSTVYLSIPSNRRF